MFKKNCTIFLGLFTCLCSLLQASIVVQGCSRHHCCLLSVNSNNFNRLWIESAETMGKEMTIVSWGNAFAGVFYLFHKTVDLLLLCTEYLTVNARFCAYFSDIDFTSEMYQEGPKCQGNQMLYFFRQYIKNKFKLDIFLILKFII